MTKEGWIEIKSNNSSYFTSCYDCRWKTTCTHHNIYGCGSFRKKHFREIIKE